MDLIGLDEYRDSKPAMLYIHMYIRLLETFLFNLTVALLDFVIYLLRNALTNYRQISTQRFTWFSLHTLTMYGFQQTTQD